MFKPRDFFSSITDRFPPDGCWHKDWEVSLTTIRCPHCGIVKPRLIYGNKLTASQQKTWDSLKESYEEYLNSKN